MKHFLEHPQLIPNTAACFVPEPLLHVSSALHSLLWLPVAAHTSSKSLVLAHMAVKGSAAPYLRAMVRHTSPCSAFHDFLTAPRFTHYLLRFSLPSVFFCRGGKNITSRDHTFIVSLKKEALHHKHNRVKYLLCQFAAPV